MATSAKQVFLRTYDEEHAITMRVLRAYPPDQVDVQPHPRVKTPRQLAWTFVMERALGTKVWNDEFATAMPSGTPPEPPQNWSDLLTAIEKAHADFRALIESTPEEKLHENVHFFTAPKTMGELTRMRWAWFLLHDEIHHRGQFSIYLRMSGAKVPSIYGPTADEPWM